MHNSCAAMPKTPLNRPSANWWPVTSTLSIRPRCEWSVATPIWRRTWPKPYLPIWRARPARSHATKCSRAGFIKQRALRRLKRSGRNVVGQAVRKRLSPCKNSLPMPTGSDSGPAVAAASSTFNLLNLMSMTKLKAGLLSLAVVVGAGTPIVVQQQSLSRLRAENQALRGQSQELEQLRAENQRIAGLRANGDELERLRRDVAELHRLRAEVARLRRET